MDIAAKSSTNGLLSMAMLSNQRITEGAIGMMHRASDFTDKMRVVYGLPFGRTVYRLPWTITLLLLSYLWLFYSSCSIAMLSYQKVFA